MGSLIDSSVLVGIERGDLDLERRLAETADEPFAISVITASELLHGPHRADDEAAPGPLVALGPLEPAALVAFSGESA